LRYNRDLCFCRGCKAPILRSMAPREQRTRSDLRLLRTYRGDRGLPINGRYPNEELATMLSTKGMPRLMSRDWLSLKYECEEIQKVYIGKVQKTHNKSAMQREFATIDLLSRGKEAADLLRTSGFSPNAFVAYVLEGLDSRQSQLVYLRAVDEVSSKLFEAQKAYYGSLKQMHQSLMQVVKRSESAALPMHIANQAREKGVSLKFVHMMKKSRQPSRDQGGTFLATGTFSLGFLRAKSVIAWVHADLPTKEYTRIFFTFNKQPSGEWQVLVCHRDRRRNNVLFNFTITAREFELFCGAGKTAKYPYYNGWVVVNAFSLVQLLARLDAQGV